MSNQSLSPWVMPWAKETAHKMRSYKSLSVEDREQEALMCILMNSSRIQSIEVEQGVDSAKAYIGRIVTNHLMNLNADYSSQLTGMNGATRNSDSIEVRNAKTAAQNGGFSLQDEAVEDGTFADIIPAITTPIEEEIDYENFFNSCGVLAPLLMGKVDHPREWCEQFPEAANLLTETPSLRIMAVRREAQKCAKFGLDPELVTKAVIDHLDGWRGARGDYGDGDIVDASEADFYPSPELAGHFGEGSTFGAIALCKPLDEIPGYRPGYAESLLYQVGYEARELSTKLSIEDKEGFVTSCVNRARSFLKSKGGLVKYNAVMERQQQDLFGE